MVQHDTRTGEKHVADIKLANGTVIEFQHSAISLEELQSRELFYGQMLWVVDAIPFQHNFWINPLVLPSPKAPINNDVRFFGEGKVAGSMFWRPSEQTPGSGKGPIRSRRHIEKELVASYKGHHFFVWKHARGIWLEAEKPVFLDFGTDELLWLQKYTDGEGCIQKIPKVSFLKKYAGEQLEP